MANQFLKLRRSSVPGKIPDTGSLDFGEIALNTHDGLAFMKKSGSSGEEIVIIGSTQGAFTGSFSGSFTGSLEGTASWAINALTASTADNFFVRGDLTGSNAFFTGTVTAQTLVVSVVSSSVIYSSGSNIFGDELTDKQTFTGSVDITGSLTVNGSTAVLSNQTASMSVLSASYAYTASSAVSSAYAYNADFLDGKDSTVFATTGSNVFKGSQTIDGNLFMSGSFRLIYNNDPTTNMLFGQFDGSQIHGPYYQLFGNQYSTVSQRGSAEFVYDTRNGGESGFNIVSFDGFGWTRRFRVDDSGAQVTGSLNVSNGITGSLFGTASWALNFVTSSVTSASYAYTASSAVSSSYASTASFLIGFNPHQIATGSVTASVNTDPSSIFLIKSGSVNFLNISSSGDTTLASNLFMVKNFTTNQPVLTVSQSVVKIATQSFDPTGTTEAGSIWFTSTAMYVGLE